MAATNSPKPDIPLVLVHSRETGHDSVASTSGNVLGPAESSTSLVSIGDQLSELPSNASMNRVQRTSRATRSEPLIPIEHGSPLLKSSTPQSEADQDKKVSFESDRGLGQPAVAGIRGHRTNQANLSSPNSSPAGRRSNESRSPPRHQSPLQRIFSLPLGRFHSREDPFVPVDPFAILFFNSSINKDLFLIADQVVRQTYLYFLLRLPSIYFSRICRLFQDAEVTRQEIHELIESVASGSRTIPKEWKPPHVSPALSRFKFSWEEFVVSVLREWKTLNVVSALLLSAILTMFQIPDAANDAITRTAALLSLVAALWSLSFGCIYILRFGTMRSMAKASRWAEEAQKTKTFVWWNVWVLLAMPAVWLAWSMICFCVSILSFVWRTGAAGDSPQPPSPGVELGPRIAITSLFALGVIYLGLIIRTFKSYGGIREKIQSTSTEIGVGIGGTMAGNAVSPNALGLTGVSQDTGNVGTRLSGTPVQSSGDLEKGYIPDERGRRIPFVSSKL